MTPYREVAKAALINWNGLSEEDATKIASTESVENLEGQVWAMSSVKSAAQRLGYDLLLNDEEAKEFENAVINGPENAPIFEVASKRAEQVALKETLALRSLSHIHDNWVRDNSSEKAFEKKKDREQLRQYLPLELIGFNEVKSDLLFLNPVLNSVGLSIDENKLQEVYNGMVEDYLRKNGTDIKKVIEQYPALSEEMRERLIPLANEVMQQVQANWDKNDEQSLSTFSNVKLENDRQALGVEFLQSLENPTIEEPTPVPEKSEPELEPTPEPEPTTSALSQETQALLKESQVLLETLKQEQDLSNLSMEQLKELQETGKLSKAEEIYQSTRIK